ncbi:MAG TPA: hypothetical protein PK443_06575, partial [bacterium]|nr:hypothetical protein [bacterium]
RGLLKTSGSGVGRDKENVSLFSLQTYDDSLKPTKDIVSKNTAITGHYFMDLWQINQKNENGFYVINNLSEIAKPLNVTPQELKNYIAYLSAYYYPVIKKEKAGEGKTRISIQNDFLFSAKWNFLLKDGEEDKIASDDDKVGTRLSYYLKNVPVESVEIKPNPYFIEELEGRGLGNILVSDDFIAFSQDLSDIAYKIFSLSGSNQPHFKIGFKKLISKTYLNLESQVYGVKNEKGRRIRAGKGKPYILEKIKEGFTELKDKGHIEKWSYDDKRDMFEWKYTDKIFKHKQLYTLGDKDKWRSNNKTEKRDKKNTR